MYLMFISKLSLSKMPDPHAAAPSPFIESDVRTKNRGRQSLSPGTFGER